MDIKQAALMHLQSVNQSVGQSTSIHNVACSLTLPFILFDISTMTFTLVMHTFHHRMPGLKLSLCEFDALCYTVSLIGKLKHTEKQEDKSKYIGRKVYI